LNINKRQEGDNAFVDLLNRLRIGNTTSEDTFILSKRMLTLHQDVCTEKILHIYPTLREVKEYTEEIQRRLIPNFHVHEALHTFSSFNATPGESVPEHLIPPDDRQGGGLPRWLPLSVRTRVMLLRNICTKEGLINGAMGFVAEIQFANDSFSTVYVKFDDSTVGINFVESSKNNSIPIKPYSQEFIYKGRIIDRIIFPLSPCWACTVHKIQGLLLDSVVISLGKTLFQAGQACVTMSRVRSLNQLYLVELCPQKLYADVTVLEEYDRLYQLFMTFINLT
jgi:hypothetical protein